MEKKPIFERMADWSRSRGGDLLKSIFSGDSSKLQQAFGNVFKDIGQVASDNVKKGVGYINKKGGNFVGYLRHNLTGKGYKYIDDDGNQVEVSDNDKKGVLGYFDEMIFGEGGVKGVSKRLMATGSKWFKSVASYFDYKGKDKDEIKLAGRRRRLLGTSVGALIGANLGILGGPLVS